jgi:hypothetical protein
MVIDGASQDDRDCPAPINPSERFTAASVVSLATVGPHGRSPAVATGAGADAGAAAGGDAGGGAGVDAVPPWVQATDRTMATPVRASMAR